jgi:hypothetical protein
MGGKGKSKEIAKGKEKDREKKEERDREKEREREDLFFNLRKKNWTSISNI